jgi:hypothetical protein
MAAVCHVYGFQSRLRLAGEGFRTADARCWRISLSRVSVLTYSRSSAALNYGERRGFLSPLVEVESGCLSVVCEMLEGLIL